MSKQEFLIRLRKGLYGLPQGDIEERLAFYSEMIDDHMEDGLSEEEAVSAAGSIDEIVAQVMADSPLTKSAKELKPKRRPSAGEIMLLVLGSPIWLSLGIAACAVVLSLCVVLWSLFLCVWAMFALTAACSVGGVLSSCIILAVGRNVAPAFAMLAAGIVCVGLSIFLFYGCRAATKGIWALTKKTAIKIKNCFIKKEAAR